MRDLTTDQPAADVRQRSWPVERGRRVGVVAQFGEARADLVHWGLTTGDPLADAVVEEIQQDGSAVREALAAGIRAGLSSLESPPPAVAALLAHAENFPDYVDDRLVDEGSLPFFNAPGPVHAVALSAGSLIRVYQSPSIAKVLAATGRLITGAEHRIGETGEWVNRAMMPGSLRVGGDGYVATLQIRMMHAHVRHAVRKRGFDETAYGVAINQVDLARTWMDFTLTAYRAESLMGFDRTSEEIASLYRYWWHLGRILGVDAQFIEGILTHAQAARVDALLEAVTGTSSPESAELALATVDAVASELQSVTRLPARLGRQALYAFAGRFQPATLVRELRLPRARAADAVLAAAIREIHRRRLRMRERPAAWDRYVRANLAQARALLPDQEKTG